MLKEAKIGKKTKKTRRNQPKNKRYLKNSFIKKSVNIYIENVEKQIKNNKNKKISRNDQKKYIHFL